MSEDIRVRIQFIGGKPTREIIQQLKSYLDWAEKIYPETNDVDASDGDKDN